MARILIVEDEFGIAAFVEDALRQEGHSSVHAANVSDAKASLRDAGFDLVLLDLALPDADGRDVLRHMRGRGDATPVIVLTAQTEIDELVASLDLGANDYVTKPFAVDELMARVRARLRGESRSGDRQTLAAAGVSLDLLSRRLEVDGRQVELSNKEFQLLRLFMEHPSQVMSKAQLLSLSRVWGYDFEPESNVVEVYVNYLRKKLGRTRIETVRGAGYRFVG
jgi:DNA-binding response OmpR family regulator